MRQVARNAALEGLACGLAQKWFEFAQHGAGRYEYQLVALLGRHSGAQKISQLADKAQAFLGLYIHMRLKLRARVGCAATAFASITQKVSMAGMAPHGLVRVDKGLPLR